MKFLRTLLLLLLPAFAAADDERGTLIIRIDNPLPTRAEVTDVANAVYEQADAIMLSGETAAGKYPVRCVEVLDTISRRIEMTSGLDFFKERPPPDSQRAHIAEGACRLADSLDAKAIVAIDVHR